MDFAPIHSMLFQRISGCHALPTPSPPKGKALGAIDKQLIWASRLTPQVPGQEKNANMVGFAFGVPFQHDRFRPSTEGTPSC